MNSMVSEQTSAYNSFSGSDIRAMIGPYPFSEIQAISYSITREKAPVYTMGTPDPRSYSRGKRGIAGSLIWINFDRHALLNLIWTNNGKFCANVDDVRPQFLLDADGYANQNAVYNSTLVRNLSPLDVGANIDQFDNPVLGSPSATSWKMEAAPWYSDQILPFDITLSGVNEMGAATAMKIFGVELLNEGYGVSVDDTQSEMQATFVAREIEPWLAVASPFWDLTD
jgi:hypothetical protein